MTMNKRASEKTVRFTLYILCVLLIASAGCIQPAQETGTMNLQLDVFPNPVYMGETTSLTATLENNAKKTYRNIKIEVFDPGQFGAINCPSLSKRELKPFGVADLTCSFRAPMIDKERVVYLGVSASFDSSLNAVQPVEIISEEEKKRREMTGKMESKPRIYSYEDESISLTIEFSENLPIVARPTEQYVYFTIKNKGDGLAKINSFRVSGLPMQCDIPNEFEPIKDEFQKIACKLSPRNVNYLSVDNIIVNIDYTYEITRTIPVTIRK